LISKRSAASAEGCDVSIVGAALSGETTGKPAELLSWMPSNRQHLQIPLQSTGILRDGHLSPDGFRSRRTHFGRYDPAGQIRKNIPGEPL
jgi:hypothetical protein